jgi:hypothetical protein
MLERVTRLGAVAIVLAATACSVARTTVPPAAASGAHAQIAARKKNPGFSAAVGAYKLSFRRSQGAITVAPTGHPATLQIRELGGSKKLDLLSSTDKISHSGSTWTLSGKGSWASFTLSVTASSGLPGAARTGDMLLRLSLKVTPSKDAPGSSGPDVTLTHAPAGSLKVYVDAPPIAGNNLLLSNAQLGSTILYYSNFTALGAYFDRTQSGVTQPVFPYPGAGAKGALVGAQRNTFGYVPPSVSVSMLPHHKTTTVISSYLYLVPSIPATEAEMSAAYLQMLDAVTSDIPKPAVPTADWKSLASKSAQDLADPANWVTVGGHQYLRSYVSDTRAAPELITQAGVLAGVEAYEARYGVTVPFASTLDQDLSTYYDPVYHTVMNGLPHDPSARGESWYFVQNMISLLQMAQLGDTTAKQLLLDSTGTLISLAHINHYEFPQSFAYSDLNGGSSSLQADVAGGYAWLMLGLYDLTGDSQYLDEAKASIAHVGGKGFNLAYETQMSSYSAAAAERLYSMTHDSSYRGYALLALANVFHATRWWDCTYGACRKGSGYHTYMGLNPLTWSDYIAMLEQYEAWLGLQDYMKYAQNEPAFVTDLVKAFITYSPLTLQYALPPMLPSGAASAAAGEYSFVPHNNLSWYIPLEDLREGEATSGIIGQEIYGAGGPFMFAAHQ